MGTSKTGSQVVKGFNLRTKGFLDIRQEFATLKDMREFDEDFLPDYKFHCVCLETKKEYVFDKDNEFDVDTGKWREVSFDAKLKIYITNETLPPIADREKNCQYYVKHKVVDEKGEETYIYYVYLIDNDGNEENIGTISGDFMTRAQVEAMIKQQEEEETLTEKMLADPENLQMLTFDTQNFQCECIEGNYLKHLAVKILCKPSMQVVVEGKKKGLHLPFKPKGNMQVLVQWKPKVGEHVNEVMRHKFYDPDGVAYIDPQQFKDAVKTVKSLIVDENGYAKQKRNTTTGELLYDRFGRPECEYEEIQINAKEPTAIKILNLPLSKKEESGETYYLSSEQGFIVNWEYLYDRAKYQNWCKCNEDGVEGEYKIIEETISQYYCIDIGGFDGVHDFIPKEQKDNVVQSSWTEANKDGYIYIDGNAICEWIMFIGQIA